MGDVTDSLAKGPWLKLDLRICSHKYLATSHTPKVVWWLKVVKNKWPTSVILPNGWKFWR
jgi:hypothetical protein